MKKINEAERLEQMTQYERPFWERGIAVAGMDEVGRGPLAGYAEREQSRAASGGLK